MARAPSPRRKKPPPAWLRLGPPIWLQNKTPAQGVRRKRPPQGWVRIVFAQRTAQEQRVKLQYQPQGGALTSIVLAYAAAKAKLKAK